MDNQTPTMSRNVATTKNNSFFTIILILALIGVIIYFGFSTFMKTDSVNSSPNETTTPLTAPVPADIPPAN